MFLWLVWKRITRSLSTQPTPNQIASLTRKLRDLRLRTTRLAATLSVTDENNAKLQQQLQEVTTSKDDLIADHIKQQKVLKQSMQEMQSEMQQQLTKLEAEVSLAATEVSTKTNTITRVESALKSDITRLELKLANQVLGCDITTSSAHYLLRYGTYCILRSWCQEIFVSLVWLRTTNNCWVRMSMSGALTASQVLSYECCVYPLKCTSECSLHKLLGMYISRHRST